MKPLLFPIIFAGLAALLLPLQEAGAQWNNAPYQPSFRGAAGGVGMSPAYRQVIILDRLSDNVSRNNLFRGPAGQLVDIERRDGQAFVVSPEGFPVGPSRSITRRGGFGYGATDGFATRSYPRAAWSARSHASVAFNDWWPIVSASDRASSGPRQSASPINSWIAQLDSL